MTLRTSLVHANPARASPRESERLQNDLFRSAFQSSNSFYWSIIIHDYIGIRAVVLTT